MGVPVRPTTGVRCLRSSALCSTGDRQSPIDLSGYIEARSAPALIFNYSQNALRNKATMGKSPMWSTGKATP